MIGDSIFRMWIHMERDMLPYKTYNAGFGGSITSATLDHANRIVIDYYPITIVYNCGNNDIMAFNLTAEEAANNFKKFVTKVRAELPDVRIIKTSLLPSPYRDYLGQKVDNEMIKLDKLIKDFV